MHVGRIVRFPWEARMRERRALGRLERVRCVDRFKGPLRERARVLAEVRESHDLLRTLPGFSRELVVERRAGGGELSIVSVIEWDGPAAQQHAGFLLCPPDEHVKQGADEPEVRKT